MADKLRVPLGATFMRSDGSQVTVDAFLKAIADAILAEEPYPPGMKAGQQVINAVWDAQRTIEIMGWAGLEGAARGWASSRPVG